MCVGVCGWVCCGYVCGWVCGAGEELVAVISYIQHISMVSLCNSLVYDYEVKVAGKYDM